MGVQACRLPAPKPLKRSKPSKPSQPPKRQSPCNLQPTGVQRLASNAGHSDPTARSIASSKAARPSQPTGVPRPHPWLLMGVQACRLPAPKPLKRSKPSKPSQPPKRQNPCNLPSANRRPEACLQRRPQRPHGQIHCFFQGRQAFAANRRPKATSMASYGRPSFYGPMWGSVQPNECWIDFGASCNTSWWGNRPQHGNSYHAMVESFHQLVLIRMCHLLPKFMNPSFHLPSSLTCSMRMDVYCAGASSPTPKQGGRRHPGASPFYFRTLFPSSKNSISKLFLKIVDLFGPIST